MKFQLLLLLVALAVLIACGGGQDDPAPTCANSDLSLLLQTKADAACGQNDGNITVTASAGAGSYTYSKDGTTFQPTGTFSNLAASNYTITVKDANSCSKTLSVNILNTDGINMQVTTAAAGCGTSNGTIAVAPTGGTPPYQFRLGTGPFGNTGNLGGLSTGSYAVTAKDADGCEITQQVLINSGISYSQTISTIITASCASANCHGGTQPPDFRVLANVRASAQLIKAKTADRSMPKDGVLSNAEIQAIACWVDDGALAN